ncbi:uncharacterized protein LOC119550240 [Drosophila subpulchrella]|uniref:uncharacterized protein LOC119550240 n=1 Tax=Drosophila subpulchrella TaxID=1486046 RepID=UPI0018A1A5A8|nr:uncharacterized protein LOC119550240 [Drosophila subpulchrella]
MKVSIFGELNTFELFVLCTLIPAVFVYLWSLITGDMKNFKASKLGYTVYTARDPVNCYQDYVPEKQKDS